MDYKTCCEIFGITDLTFLPIAAMKVVESVLVYAMQSTVGFIDLESYSDKYSHSFRVAEHHGRFSLKIEDLPF